MHIPRLPLPDFTYFQLHTPLAYSSCTLVQLQFHSRTDPRSFLRFSSSQPALGCTLRRQYLGCTLLPANAPSTNGRTPCFRRRRWDYTLCWSPSHSAIEPHPPAAAVPSFLVPLFSSSRLTHYQPPQLQSLTLFCHCTPPPATATLRSLSTHTHTLPTHTLLRNRVPPTTTANPASHKEWHPPPTISTPVSTRAVYTCVFSPRSHPPPCSWAPPHTTSLQLSGRTRVLVLQPSILRSGRCDCALAAAVGSLAYNSSYSLPHLHCRLLVQDHPQPPQPPPAAIALVPCRHTHSRPHTSVGLANTHCQWPRTIRSIRPPSDPSSGLANLTPPSHGHSH